MGARVSAGQRTWIHALRGLCGLPACALRRFSVAETIAKRTQKPADSGVAAPHDGGSARAGGRRKIVRCVSGRCAGLNVRAAGRKRALNVPQARASTAYSAVHARVNGKNAPFSLARGRDSCAAVTRKTPNGLGTTKRAASLGSSKQSRNSPASQEREYMRAVRKQAARPTPGLSLRA